MNRDDRDFEREVKIIAEVLNRWFARRHKDRAACIGAMLSLIAQECAEANSEQLALAKLQQTGKVMGSLFKQAREMGKETVH